MPVIRPANRARFLPVLAVVAAAGAHGALAQVTTVPVVLSGQQVDGFPAGRTYSSFTGFMWNRTGTVVFTAGVNGGLPPPFSGEGMWTSSGGVRTQVVLGRETFNEPGLDGYRFTESFLLIGINDSNQIAWRSSIQAPGVSGVQKPSIWRADSGQKHPVAYRELPATGLPNTTFGDLYPTNAYNEVFSNTGKVGFWSSLVFDGQTQLNNESLWTGAPGDLQVVVREGFSIPGPPPTLLFGNNDPSVNLLPRMKMNAGGAVAFAGPTRPGDGYGLWVGTPGQPYTRASANVTIESFDLNNAGHLVYDGVVAPGNIEEVRLFAGGVTTAVARSGAAAPVGRPNVQYNRLSDAIIGADDRVLFSASLLGDGVTSNNDHALFMRCPDGLYRLVLREGDPVPGLPGAFDSPSNFALSALGEVAFTANRQGIEGDGLWIVDVYNQLHLIAQEGNPFEVGPGDVRTVAEILLPSSFRGPTREGYISGGQDGLPLVLNDSGQVLFRLRFTDQSSGLFIAGVPIPAPASAPLLALAGLAAARRRRAR